MAEKYQSSRFKGPSDAIDLERLEKETQKLFFLAFLLQSLSMLLSVHTSCLKRLK